MFSLAFYAIFSLGGSGYAHEAVRSTICKVSCQYLQQVEGFRVVSEDTVPVSGSRSVDKIPSRVRHVHRGVPCAVEKVVGAPGFQGVGAFCGP